jgi:hypothetical protein
MVCGTMCLIDALVLVGPGQARLTAVAAAATVGQQQQQQAGGLRLEQPTAAATAA